MSLKQYITQNVLEAIQNVYQINPKSVEIQAHSRGSPLDV